MYENLKRLYKQGKISVSGIENAVSKNWITQDQANKILGQ